jgi:hypothetical protein
LFAACQKDNDTIDWSPTQALPTDTVEVDETPGDTNQVPAFPFQWQAVLQGNEAFIGDSASAVYTYDTLAAMHEFSCIDQLGRQMILRLPDLEIGADTLSFESSVSITLIDGSQVFDASANPNGYIAIYDNSNGRISALFESDLTDLAGSGQEQEVVNGVLQNVRYQ